MRPKKPQGMLSDLRLFNRYYKFHQSSADSDSREVDAFHFGIVARWFTDLKDLECGKETLRHALRAFSHLSDLLGFECRAVGHFRLRKIAND